MSSASDYKHSEPSEDSSNESSRPPTRSTSRRQSPASHTPRKRPRLETIDPARIRKYHLEGKYNDAYRLLFNEDVTRAAARFETDSESFQYYSQQIGASHWSAREQAVFFAALERLGRDDIPGIAGAIGTKSIPETQELLLLLHDAASRQGDAKLTLCDVPAAIDVGEECNEQLDLAGEALAWFQEVFEAGQERERFGDYWLITPAVAEEIESAHDTSRSRASTSPPVSEPEPSRRGGRVVVGYTRSATTKHQDADTSQSMHFVQKVQAKVRSSNTMRQLRTTKYRRMRISRAVPQTRGRRPTC
jgi:RNA polymerase I-specific transcription initiation factor RRN5